MVIYTTYDIPRVSSPAIYVSEIVKAYASHMHVICAWIQVTISYASRYHILLAWIDKFLCISFCNGNERPRARDMPIKFGLQIPIGCVTLVSITPTIVSICYGHLNSASLQNTCIWYRYHFQLGIYCIEKSWY